MAAAAQYRTEHLAATPPGFKVRSIKRGSHVVRVAFPPGRRKKGSGKVLEILHPKSEKNASCIVSTRAKNNPSELLIFGNPSAAAAKRATRERAAKIRAARLNPRPFAGWKHFTTKEKSFLRTIHMPAPKNEEEVRAYKETLKKIDEINARERGKNPVHMQVSFDRGIQKYLAYLYDPKFGNLYGTGFTKKQAAKALHEQVRKARRTGTWRNPSRRRRGDRRNPSETEQAVRLFETFHGRSAKNIVEKQVSTRIRTDYTTLGDLEYLKVKTPIGDVVTFEFDGDGVKLASSPDGKQLACIGGKQNLLPLLDSASQQKDLIELGECLEVQYLARKAHNNFEPTSYFHKFGEKTGARPMLMFDKLKAHSEQAIFFIGGEYFINTKVALSPGIEN